MSDISFLRVGQIIPRWQLPTIDSLSQTLAISWWWLVVNIFNKFDCNVILELINCNGPFCLCVWWWQVKTVNPQFSLQYLVLFKVLSAKKIRLTKTQDHIIVYCGYVIVYLLYCSQLPLQSGSRR